VYKRQENSLRQAYDRNNIPPQERSNQPLTQGRYEWIDKQQLAVIELHYSNNPMRVMRVVGIENDELISISCVSPTGTPLDIHAKTGECAESIAEQFNLNL
jgi:hypothetical protein